MLVEDQTKQSFAEEAFEAGEKYPCVVVGLMQGKTEAYGQAGVMVDANVLLLQVRDENGNTQYKTTKAFKWNLSEKSNLAIYLAQLIGNGANEERTLKAALLDKGMAVISPAKRLCYDTEKFLGLTCDVSFEAKASKKDPAKVNFLFDKFFKPGKKSQTIEPDLSADIPDFYKRSFGREYDHIDIIEGLKWRATGGEVTQAATAPTKEALADCDDAYIPF